MEAHKRADQIRREAAEKRKQELHDLGLLLGEAKLDHQLLLNSGLNGSNPLALFPKSPIGVKSAA